jgi:hypothetical protein
MVLPNPLILPPAMLMLAVFTVHILPITVPRQ